MSMHGGQRARRLSSQRLSGAAIPHMTGFPKSDRTLALAPADRKARMMVSNYAYVAWCTVALTSSPVAASSIFDGAWRPDLSTASLPTESDTFLLKSGSFVHDDEAVKADGAFHAASGDYIDEKSIAVVDDQTVLEIDRLHGRTVYAVRYEVSADGTTLVIKNLKLSDPKASPFFQTTCNRVAPAPPGSHRMSGSWTAVKIDMDNDGSKDWLLRVDGDTFSSFYRDGSGFRAVIGDPPIPKPGDSSHELVAIARPTDNTVVQSAFAANGELGATMTLTVLPDGKTMRAITRIVKSGEEMTIILHKQ
jgi:hypothetical protein